MTRKKPLTPKQKAVCARLKKLWTERSKQLGLTQEDAAAALKMQQSGFSHYLNGYTAIGFEAMFRVAQLLRVHPYDIDPDFAQLLPPDLRLAVDGMLVNASPQVAKAYGMLRTSALQLHDALGNVADHSNLRPPPISE